MAGMKVFSLIRRVTLVRVVLGLLILGGGFVGIGMLPGSVEGNYRGLGMRCLCDSVGFWQFRNGKILSYGSEHPPGDLIGRYEVLLDGSVDTYFMASMEGEEEEFLGRAYPRLWFTRFEGADQGSEWLFKSPKIGAVRETIESHEVISTRILEGRVVEKTYYDAALKPVKREIFSDGEWRPSL